MPKFPREELEEMMRRWVAANDRSGPRGDWSAMGDFYTEDAEYRWNNGPAWEFAAQGREQIRDWVFGTEMAGLEGWTYPYDKGVGWCCRFTRRTSGSTPVTRGTGRGSAHTFTDTCGRRRPGSSDRGS